MKKKLPIAFTLIEVLLSTLIISAVLTTAFYAISYISIWKIRLVEATKIEKEGFYFSEKLFEMIKQWWILDFEEYYNRRIVGNTGSTAFSSGHYAIETGFWNFGSAWIVGSNNYGSSLYYCISPDGTSMGTGWCLSNNNSLSNDNNGNPQRYGQYAAQFIDYNSDYDSDWWDEDGDGSIKWDDDDIFIGQWPVVFEPNLNIHELYLLSGDKQTRTFFRWNVWLDPDRPIGEDCDISNPAYPVGDGCLGTIEFLVLEWRDWWDNHDLTTIDTNGTQFDGTIDTWIINSKFTWNNITIAGSEARSYWEKLFPDTISVSDFEVFAYPHKDIDLAWKDNNSTINQAPYIRLKLTLSPSWKKRKIIQWKIPSVEIATTIALTDEFSK